MLVCPQCECIFTGVARAGNPCMNPRRMPQIGGDTDYCQGFIIDLDAETRRLQPLYDPIKWLVRL